jgi:hypothetical protein
MKNYAEFQLSKLNRIGNKTVGVLIRLVTRPFWNTARELVIILFKVEIDRNILSYSMEQNPSWEANKFSTSQDIPRILWNPKVHYRSTSARHLSLSWASSTQSIPPTFYFLKIHLNSIFPFTPGSLKWFFPSGFPTKTLYTPVLFPIHATCSAHLIFLPFITRTILGEECTSLCARH